MNNQISIVKPVKKVEQSVKPIYYSTSRTYQDILRRDSHVKPVSEMIKVYIQNKFSELA